MPYRVVVIGAGFGRIGMAIVGQVTKRAEQH
jgi:hypothetical protein